MSEDPDLWSDPDKAQSLMKERNRLEGKIKTLNDIEQSLNDNTEFIALGEEEGDEDIVSESEASLS